MEQRVGRVCALFEFLQSLDQSGKHLSVPRLARGFVVEEFVPVQASAKFAPRNFHFKIPNQRPAPKLWFFGGDDCIIKNSLRELPIIFTNIEKSRFFLNKYIYAVAKGFPAKCYQPDGKLHPTCGIEWG